MFGMRLKIGCQTRVSHILCRCRLTSVRNSCNLSYVELMPSKMWSITLLSVWTLGIPHPSKLRLCLDYALRCMRQLRETNHGPQNRLSTGVRHILCRYGLTISGNSCNLLSVNTMTCKMQSSLVCRILITFYKSLLWLIRPVMANLEGLIMGTWGSFVANWKVGFRV